MATYLGKHGSKIQNYTTNPDNPNEGEVWYNETDNVLKFVYPNVTSAGAWRTIVSINSARRGLGSNGTYTSSLIYGGYESDYSGKTESWNGSAWTEVNDLNTAREGANSSNAGIQTSGLAFGGRGSPGASIANTEIWNGANWVEQNDLNTASQTNASGGYQSNPAAINFGGAGPPSLAVTEEWNVPANVIKTLTD